MKRNSFLLTLLLLAAFAVLSACRPAAAPTEPPTPIAALPTKEPTAAAIEPRTPVPETLLVDPGTSLGPVSPYIFGTNYGPMHAVPLEMMPLVEEAGFTVLRFPGGAWTDAVDMRPF